MGSKLPEYFKIGFKESGTGMVKTIAAFSDPHDAELLKQIRRLAPDARVHETHHLVQVRVRLSDARVEILGDFATSMSREMAKYIALIGTRALQERIREAAALVVGTHTAIRARILPTPSILKLPARVVTEAGEEDKTLDIGDEGDRRPILLNLHFSIRGNDLKIHVPSLTEKDLFRDWGNDFRRTLVREEAIEVLNAHGLFTRA